MPENRANAMFIAYESARLLERDLAGKRVTGGFAGFSCTVVPFDLEGINHLSERILRPLIAAAARELTSENGSLSISLPTGVDAGWPTAKDEPKVAAHQAVFVRPGELPFVVRARIWPDLKHDGFELRVDVAALAVAA